RDFPIFAVGSANRLRWHTAIFSDPCPVMHSAIPQQRANSVLSWLSGYGTEAHSSTEGAFFDWTNSWSPEPMRLKVFKMQRANFRSCEDGFDAKIRRPLSW